MSRILIGTCSWTDPSLLASGFYPKGASSPEGRLAFYAQQFPMVESDATYYALLAERTARLWVRRTPQRFVFDIKAFSLFTGHPTRPQVLPRDLRPLLPPGKGQIYHRDLSGEVRDELWARFSQSLLPLDSAGKLGVVLFQFPPWFYPGPEAQEYILSCRERLPQYRLAVEFRNGWWLAERHREETLDFLRRNGLAYVAVDEPQGFRSSVPPVAEATTDIAVVRFHGRNRENWEKKGITATERFRYLYPREELAEWLPRIQHLTYSAGEVHLLFNNCYSDWAVRNGRDLSHMLGSQPSLLPDFQG